MSHLEHNNVGSDASELTSVEKAEKKAVRATNEIVDFVFIILMLFLLVFAIYAKWDSNQVYTAADPVQYIQYKPSPPEMVPFEELQKINPDVLGWLTIYDTNIDYPLVQSDDDFKYLNTNAMGEPEGSGALFLDSQNSPDFSDFNTVIYGHHMAHHEMFGDLDLFLDEDFWQTHEYGNLIFNAQNHGLQFIAMLQCDAYDFQIYAPAISSEEGRIRYINHIYETAKYVRGIDTETLRSMQEDYNERVKQAKKDGTPLSEVESSFANTRSAPVTSDDHLVLMSTCSADITNGRFILVAKLLDHPVENPFPDEKHKTPGIDTTKITAKIGKWPAWVWILILSILILILLALYLLSNYLYKRKPNQNGENAHDENNENH